MMFGSSIPLPGGPLPPMDPRIAQIANAPPPHKSGMFAQGGVGRNILGSIADALMQHAGMQPIYMPTMMERAKEAEREQQYQRERQDKQTDWQAEYDYKLAHPTQGDDEYTRALIASGVQPGTPEYAQHMGTRRDLLENPPQYMNVPGVGLVQIPRSPTQAPPTAPVGKLTRIGAGGPAPGPGGFQY